MIELLVPAPVAAVTSFEPTPQTPGGSPVAGPVAGPLQSSPAAPGDRAGSPADPVEDLDMYPEEAAAVARAVPRRRAEYAQVRACARRAMVRLGLPAGPVPSGPDRAPIWPNGLIGSMTHCDGYRAAALALVGEVVTIGIDAEVNGPLPAGVLDYVSMPSERAWVSEYTAVSPSVNWDRLLFSAKEAVFKAWYPLTGRWLGFEQAELRPGPPVGRGEPGTFVARLLVPGPVVGLGQDSMEITTFEGRWMADDRHLVTAITVLPS